MMQPIEKNQFQNLLLSNRLLTNGGAQHLDLFIGTTFLKCLGISNLVIKN